MKLFLEIQKPHRWVLVGAKNQLKDQGILNNLDNYRVPKKVDQVIGVTKGESIACHSVLIPGKRRNHIISALPYALEDRLSDDVEELHFKLLSWQVDQPSLAAVVAKSDLNNWVETFRLHGIELDAIVPEYFLLPQHPKGDVIISKLDEQRYCIRTEKYRGMSLDADGFEYWWQTTEKQNLRFSVTNLEFAKSLIEQDKTLMPQTPVDYISHWDIGDHFTAWLGKSEFTEEIQEISILSGNYIPKHHGSGAGLFKVSGIICLIAVFVYWAGLKFEHHTLVEEKQRINTELRQIFSDNFPGEPYLDRPRSQLQNILNRLQKGQLNNSDFQLLMTLVSEVSPQYNAVVEELNYKDKEMTILFTVQDLSSLDRIRSAFNQSGKLTAELLSSGARDDKVNGRFKISKKI